MPMNMDPAQISGNSFASLPAWRATGTFFTGGSATTTKPHVLIEPTGVTSTAWSTSGTAFGINAANGFAGSLIDFKVNNTSKILYDTGIDALKVANVSGYGGQIRYTGFQTRSTGTIGWASTDSADGSADAGFLRVQASVIAARVSTTPNAILASCFISVKATTPVTVATTDSGTIFTNEGATAKIVHNLPPAAAGLGPYTYIVQDADGSRVVAGSGDTIRIAASVSAAAGNIDSTTIGSTVTLVCINATEWIATAANGTWAFDAA